MRLGVAGLHKVIRHREPHAIWPAGAIDVCTDAEVQIPKSEQQPENAISASSGRKNLSFIIVLSLGYSCVKSGAVS